MGPKIIGLSFFVDFWKKKKKEDVNQYVLKSQIKRVENTSEVCNGLQNFYLIQLVLASTSIEL